MNQLATELTNLYNRLHRQPEFPLVTELTNLYNHLRRQPEFPLGIDQFLLLTRALRLGFALAELAEPLEEEPRERLRA